MTELSLRHIPRSRSMRVLWLLEEIGCDYAVEIVEEGGSLRDILCSVLRVPALSDGDVKMHETGAMIEWLCETRAPHLTRSPGSKARAGWLDWLHFGETLAGCVVSAQAGSAPTAAPVFNYDEMKRLELGLDLLGGWLEENEWLLSSFSGVDCHVGYSVWIAAQVVSLDHHPHVQAYLERCSARMAFQRAQMT